MTHRIQKTVVLTAVVAILSSPTFAQSANFGASGHESENSAPPIIRATRTFTGVAPVGSPIHNWISQSASGNQTKEINYRIKYMSETGDIDEELLNFLSWGQLSFPDDHSRDDSGDPPALVGPPSIDGSQVGVTGSSCNIGMFGPESDRVVVRSDWTWLGNDNHGETYGWHLEAYEALFFPRTQAPPSC